MAIEIGQRFGRRVVSHVYARANGTRDYELQCDCGRRSPWALSEHALLNGLGHYCGKGDCHEHGEAAAALKVGQRVGTLVAKSKRELVVGQYWRRAWKCDCGRSFLLGDLRALRDRTCPICRGQRAVLTPEQIKQRHEDRTVRNRARAAVSVAVASGVLVRPSICSACGEPSARIHGHHRDYAHPLAVQWLCPGCHVAEHMRARRVAPALSLSA